MILETPRLGLRRLTQEDFPALCRTLQDPVAMTAYEGAFSDGEVQAWLDRQLDRYAQYGNFGLRAVIERESGLFVGQCGLTLQSWKGVEVLEIGYLFQRDRWHRGYATEAMPPRPPGPARPMPLTLWGRRRSHPSSGTPISPPSGWPCEMG